MNARAPMKQESNAGVRANYVTAEMMIRARQRHERKIRKAMAAREYGEPHDWFAWFPVRLKESGRAVWLRTVTRVLVRFPGVEGWYPWTCWEYRERYVVNLPDLRPSVRGPVMHIRKGLAYQIVGDTLHRWTGMGIVWSKHPAGLWEEVGRF